MSIDILKIRFPFIHDITFFAVSIIFISLFPDTQLKINHFGWHYIDS